MKTCIKCRLTFPNDLISPMFVDGKYIILCAICANDMMNELTGQPKGTPFLGEQAQELHKLTLEYNKNRKVEDE